MERGSRGNTHQSNTRIYRQFNFFMYILKFLVILSKTVHWILELLPILLLNIFFCFIFTLAWLLILYRHGDLEELNLPDHQKKSKPCVANINSFMSIVLFSIETQFTIGYGSRYITEECPLAVLLLCFQVAFNVYGQLLLAYKFMKKWNQSKCTILFCKKAVVCIQNKKLCLMFRVDTERNSCIFEPKIKAVLWAKWLPMQREELIVSTHAYKKSPLLDGPIIIVHKINIGSPFYHMGPTEMINSKFKIAVIVEGTVVETGDLIRGETSYLPTDILWSQRLNPQWPNPRNSNVLRPISRF